LTKKRRTREHVISDLAVNHVERQALLCGYSVERISFDYGIDLNLYTYNQNGEIENGCVYIQVKATDNPKYSMHKSFISFSIDKADLESWLDEPLPVVLIVYDAQIDKAYWIYIQRYFEALTEFNLETLGKTYTIRLDTNQVINEEAVRKFASFKENVLAQVEGVIRHNA